MLILEGLSRISQLKLWESPFKPAAYILKSTLICSPYYFILMYTPYSHCPSVPVPLLCTFLILWLVSEAGLPSHKTRVSTLLAVLLADAAPTSSMLCFFFPVLPAKAAAQSHLQHFTRGLSPAQQAQQYKYNALLFPGKSCTDSTSNLHFLCLTRAP